MFKIRFISMLVLLAAVATGAVAQTTYKVSVKGGTEDATSWQGKAGTGEYQALPLEGVAAGTAVTVKYNGTKMVKSVKAKKKPTAEDKGKLICTDGHIHAYGEDAECTKARVAKIIYIGPTGHATYSHGLALALTDEGQMAWDPAMTACNNKNTSTPVTGATWLLASRDQWGYMMGTDGAGSYTALRDGSNLQSGTYWSSTDDGSNYAWCYSFAYGNWRDVYKASEPIWVRACLAFLAQETVTLNHSANNTWAIAEMPAGDVELEVEYFNITVPTANTADINAGSTTPLINAGSTTEHGATMKYLVTATNEQPTSTDGFSADVPTAEGRTAGTYYVWYYLDFESGDDSDISALAVEVKVKPVSHYAITVKEGTEDATSWQVKAGTGEYQALPLEGVAAGTAVSVKYSGWKLVKSVKAKKALNLTSPAVGQVIGNDGKNYDYASLPGGVTAVAKICYVSGSNGLALALADEGEMHWSTAISTCAAHTPAFTGGTWKLATQDEWNNMITAAGGHTALRDGFSSVGGSNMHTGPYRYWSSTEYNSVQARTCYFDDGRWSYDRKDTHFIRVRACLAFGAQETVTLNHSANNAWAQETVTLNHSANNTWAIAEMPAGDVELEVEYFNITVPTANTADIYAGSTTPLINAGSTTEDGATMKYLVTATNEQPTSTDGFSTDVPTAEGRTAGTYYVWYYLDFASGDDSDISALAVEVTVSVHVTMKEGTLDADNWQGKAGEGEYQALPLTGLEAGTAVTVKYNGTKKVKSVKAKKKPTAEDKGKLICTDGHIHAYGEDAECTKARVAKIIYIGPTGHATYNHGLALALEDVSSTQTWCSQTSNTCLTTQYSSASDAKGDMAGLANTDALVGHGSHTHAAANAARNYNSGTHPTGTSAWFLPSAGQWDKMATEAGGYDKLGLKSGYYWSSSERDARYAWFFYSDNGFWSYDAKVFDYPYLVRSCLAF